MGFRPGPILGLSDSLELTELTDLVGAARCQAIAAAIIAEMTAVRPRHLILK
jgi:hypothetical protein